ncbi:hypothetical protein ACC716_24765 [Rhizobium johnstonii]|uniref:hypothetical protein n=1 Tax=Rhizobium johnstonii TaxID=3019933 RepID=UPI003F9A9BEE
MTKIDQLIRLMGELDRGYDRTKTAVSAGSRTVLQPDQPTHSRLEMLFAEDEGDGLPDEPELSIPTGEPLATVLPPDRTQGHVRGYVPNPRTKRSVSYASTLERICAYSQIANAQIHSVEDQPANLYYQKETGNEHYTRFDYRSVFGRNRYTVAIAVRPSHLIDKEDLRDTISRINSGHLGDFADEAIILTENELTYPIGWNSKAILRSLRGRNKEHCEWLTDRLKDVNGWIEIRHLTKGLPTAFGLNAVWCLIFDGLLQPLRRDVLLPNMPFVSVDRAKLEEVR